MSDLCLQLTGDGSYTLSRGNDHETYHSTFGAVQESHEVFLRNSAVQQRLEHQQPTRVLEIGFGSGLNFILTAQCAQRDNTSLHYVGCDPTPPPTALISELLNHNTTDCEQDIDRLVHYINSADSGEAIINDYTRLQLLTTDACITDFAQHTFHAVYLDAFSYREAPQLWQSPFLKKLFDALLPNGKLATYSVNRAFKTALHEAGFCWQKHPGPAGKREVIVATAVR